MSLSKPKTKPKSKLKSKSKAKPKSKPVKEITYQLGRPGKEEEVSRTYTTGVQYPSTDHPLNEGETADRFRDQIIRAVAAYLIEESPTLPETRLELVLQAVSQVLQGKHPLQRNEHFHNLWKRLKEDNKLTTDNYLVLAKTLIKTVQKQPVVERIQHLGTEAMDKCLTYADQATTLITQGVISGTGTHAAARLAEELGDRSNLGQSAFLTLVEAGKGYCEAVKKLDDLRQFFNTHPDAWATFLLFGVSSGAKSYLAKKWRIKELGAYQFLRQVRRKLDTSDALPCSYRIFPELHETIDQTALYPPLDASAFQTALHRKIQQVETHLHQLGPNSPKIPPTKTFLNKLRKLDDPNVQGPLLSLLFVDEETGPVHFGQASLRVKSRQIQPVVGGRAKKYYSALEAVLSLAAVLTPSVFAVPPHSVRVDTLLTPEQCLTRPFSRKLQARQAYDLKKTTRDPLVYNRQPISLVMKHDQVIIRPGDASVLTQRMRQDGYVDLWVPNCQLPRLKGIIFRQRASSRPRVIERVQKRLLLRVPASANMRQILQQGAQIQLIQIMPPRGPARKIHVNITFIGHPLAFVAVKHLSPTALQAYQDDIVFLPSSNLRLATDLNRIGPDVIAFSTGSSLSSPLRQMCRAYHQTSHTLKQLHRCLSLAQQGPPSRRHRALQQEISHVERRRQNLRKEIHVSCGPEIGQQMVLTGASLLLSEALDLNPTGTRGGLAKAIYNMPDDVEILERAAYSVSVAFPDRPITLRLYRPTGTSLIHVNCPHEPPGRLKRTATHYDWAPCSQCQQLINTHINAAQRLNEHDSLVEPPNLPDPPISPSSL